CTLIAHNPQLTPALAEASQWQTFPAALASALLPHLDHPNSVRGQRLPWISKPLSRLLGHRGLTHLLRGVAAAVWG
ncbi:metal-dependent hydrolase, partial [Aeromonas veronii]|uniref:metal-dependent hydrolase n=1 Tax=Aeromonas veronii TaxID=654 RepID=UPI0038B47505